jgi:hypothetical protein
MCSPSIIFAACDLVLSSKSLSDIVFSHIVSNFWILSCDAKNVPVSLNFYLNKLSINFFCFFGGMQGDEEEDDEDDKEEDDDEDDEEDGEDDKEEDEEEEDDEDDKEEAMMKT